MEAWTRIVVQPPEVPLDLTVLTVIIASTSSEEAAVPSQLGLSRIVCFR